MYAGFEYFKNQKSSVKQASPRHRPENYSPPDRHKTGGGEQVLKSTL
jgi:hypothetical protein